MMKKLTMLGVCLAMSVCSVQASAQGNAELAQEGLGFSFLFTLLLPK